MKSIVYTLNKVKKVIKTVLHCRIYTGMQIITQVEDEISYFYQFKVPLNVHDLPLSRHEI